MQGLRPSAGDWGAAGPWPGPDQEKLDRALVAGLLLETILDIPDLPDDDQARTGAVKARLKYNLATHLAGRVSLDHFRSLIHNLERWFPYYYPLVSPALASKSGKIEPAGACGFPQATAITSHGVLREQELADWLAGGAREVLPQRPHRKLLPARLPEFFRHTQGGWFRIGDFQAHFGIDRKTAWEYLQKLRAVGLLEHNGQRSAAVRYCLADRFLLVRAGDLRQEIAGLLGDLPREVARRLADRLIATGGEAFWEDRGGEPAQPPEVRKALTSRLVAAGVLKLVMQAGRSRMVRLSPPWLQPG